MGDVGGGIKYRLVVREQSQGREDHRENTVHSILVTVVSAGCWIYGMLT